MNMKKLILHPFAFLALISLTIVSCKKEDPEPTPIVPVPTPTSSFTWQENGGSTVTADSAFWVTGSWGTGIRAYKGGLSNFFEINWDTMDNTSLGTKILAAPYGFTFLKGSDTYTCLADQNLTITGNSNNTLTGNFTVPVVGGSITSISGTFTSIPKH